MIMPSCNAHGWTTPSLPQKSLLTNGQFQAAAASHLSEDSFGEGSWEHKEVWYSQESVALPLVPLAVCVLGSPLGPALLLGPLLQPHGLPPQYHDLVAHSGGHQPCQLLEVLLSPRPLPAVMFPAHLLGSPTLREADVGGVVGDCLLAVSMSIVSLEV